MVRHLYFRHWDWGHLHGSPAARMVRHPVRGDGRWISAFAPRGPGIIWEHFWEVWEVLELARLPLRIPRACLSEGADWFGRASTG